MSEKRLSAASRIRSLREKVNTFPQQWGRRFVPSHRDFEELLQSAEDLLEPEAQVPEPKVPVKGLVFECANCERPVVEEILESNGNMICLSCVPEDS